MDVVDLDFPTIGRYTDFAPRQTRLMRGQVIREASLEGYGRTYGAVLLPLNWFEERARRIGLRFEYEMKRLRVNPI